MPPPDGLRSEPAPRRRAAVRVEDMVGMGYFPDEVGLDGGWSEAMAAPISPRRPSNDVLGDRQTA
jgi:hypothetical protein